MKAAFEVEHVLVGADVPGLIFTIGNGRNKRPG